MSGSTIGIKIADGSYYPILEQGFTGRKLAPSRRSATRRAACRSTCTAVMAAALRRPAISAASSSRISPPRGAASRRLTSPSAWTDGELDAEASDESTGETQKFAISLKTLSDEETYEIPEFRVEEESQPLSRPRTPRGNG